MSKMLTRDEALALLKEYNESDALVKHGLAVEGVMRHFARKYGEDEEKWGIVGLLHDLDYEKYPDQHCVKVQEIMQERDIDPEIIRAVASHGYGICVDIEPQSQMEKVLYTIDELTGLVNATAIMRPSKSVLDLETKSVKKKFKSKGFAAGVDREIIKKGCERLEMDLGDVIEEVILGMREVCDTIDLRGEVEN
ncbi:HDIG domain-containing protein [Eubacterium limosum]|uniref:HDIG domain-containing protein n=1 Tax=Eubacterium limosum TaxID=1736 RepID=A0ABT5UP47_EUBLI|nr:HDIG domain-containing metalloprotein [Eubacterium limosum]MCB6569021.1 HDIG domain-containing protein [Eubacterium limosum]MDE1470719.1 HDIG domain-containing protein [Eubacterium limosum]